MQKSLALEHCCVLFRDLAEQLLYACRMCRTSSIHAVEYHKQPFYSCLESIKQNGHYSCCECWSFVRRLPSLTCGHEKLQLLWDICLDVDHTPPSCFSNHPLGQFRHGARYLRDPRGVNGAKSVMKKWRRGNGTILTANLRKSAFNWPRNRRLK